MLFQKLTKSFYRSVASFEFDGVLLAVARRQVNGGEALCFVAVVGDVVSGGVHLGYDDVLLSLVLPAQGQVVWLQLLAVAAPRRVELDQDVLLLIHDDLVESVPHNDLHWSFVVLRGGLRLDDGLQFSWGKEGR